VVVGGQGFADGPEQPPAAGAYLDAAPSEVVQQIEGLLSTRGV
jgi:hypothetical protein